MGVYYIMIAITISKNVLPSDDFGIPTRNSKDVTRDAEPLGLPKQQFVETRCELMHQDGENACILK